jgi:hypothetical protein
MIDGTQGAYPCDAGRYWEGVSAEERFAVQMFLTAKEAVVRAGYAWEIEWQEERCLETLTETLFMREVSWVILSSGMREAVVAKVFEPLAVCFGGLKSPRFIVGNRRVCVARALKIFRHRGKLMAIVKAAEWVQEVGVGGAIELLRLHGPKALEHLPFLGPATAAHLAKNLGVRVAKADRHLTRLANAVAMRSPGELCESIAGHLREDVGVVDVVLWRACVLGVLRSQ